MPTMHPVSARVEQSFVSIGRCARKLRYLPSAADTRAVRHFQQLIWQLHVDRKEQALLQHCWCIQILRLLTGTIRCGAASLIVSIAYQVNRLLLL
jgi:hypothetical protein